MVNKYGIVTNIDLMLVYVEHSKWKLFWFSTYLVSQKRQILLGHDILEILQFHISIGMDLMRVHSYFNDGGFPLFLVKTKR